MQTDRISAGAEWNTRDSVQPNAPQARFPGTKTSINELVRSDQQELFRLSGADRRNHHQESSRPPCF